MIVPTKPKAIFIKLFTKLTRSIVGKGRKLWNVSNSFKMGCEGSATFEKTEFVAEVFSETEAEEAFEKGEKRIAKNNRK
jgi:hypothetical protein